MKAGDLVVRTYGEGNRPRGFILKRAPSSVTRNRSVDGSMVWASAERREDRRQMVGGDK